MKKIIKVLVAEDNIGDFSLLKYAVKDLSFDIELTHFKNGQELIEFSQEHQFKGYDFLFLDINMPKIDGHGVLNFFKDNPKYHKPPIIVLTSSSKPEDIKRCYDNGANGYIRKPLSIDEFQQAISTTINFWGNYNIG